MNPRESATSTHFRNGEIEIDFDSPRFVSFFFQGDSGGPLMQKKRNNRKGRLEVVGVVSHGTLSCANLTISPDESGSDFYSNVMYHLKFILKTIKK